MRLFAFLFLYGTVAFMGLFLVIFWGLTAKRRIAAITHPWYQDRYSILSLSIAGLTIGLMLETGARMFGNVMSGLSPILRRVEGDYIAMGIVFSLFGLCGLVWLADLERDPPRYSWLLGMLVLTGIWAVACFYILPHVPWIPAV